MPWGEYRKDEKRIILVQFVTIQSIIRLSYLVIGKTFLSILAPETLAKTQIVATVKIIILTLKLNRQKIKLKIQV